MIDCTGKLLTLKRGCYIRLDCVASILPASDGQLDIMLMSGAGFILDSEASAQLLSFMESAEQQ